MGGIGAIDAMFLKDVEETPGVVVATLEIEILIVIEALYSELPCCKLNKWTG